MSYDRPTLSGLISTARLDIEAELAGADAQLRHRVLDVLARTLAGGLSELYGFGDWISRQILPDTADREVLARHASIWGVDRKAAVAAAGNVQLTGVNGTVVPAGTMLTRGADIGYRTLAQAVIAGATPVAVEAEDGGIAGNLAAGQSLAFVQLVAGVNSNATVLAPGLVGGAEEEDDESLLNRLLLRIQEPPQGGARTDYVSWALAQTEVTRAWSFANWLGLGTVGLTFTMDDRPNIIPTAPDVAAVQAALDLLRPVTAELIVFAPVAAPVNVTLTLNPNDAATRDAVTAELRDLFRRDGQPGGTIRRSRISEAISIAAGENYHVLAAPAADVTVAAGQLPVLGVVTFA